METREEEKKVKYGLYTFRVSYGNRSTLNTFWIEYDDVEAIDHLRNAPKGNYAIPIQNYANILYETPGHKIEYQDPEIWITSDYTTLPRGACTLGWLANEGLEDYITTLIKAGAKPDKEYTLWRYGPQSGVWEFLDGIYQGVQGRKRAKPAFIGREETTP